MGEVYRAHDPRLNRDVALKFLRPEFSGDAERLQRFVREAQTLAALNHPHIAQLYGVEDANDGGVAVRALVMEFVDGEDLAARLRRGPVPVEEACEIAHQIAAALEAAHDQGIVHRDLKPANIKIRPDGSVKVLDLGLAKAMDQGSGIGDQGSGDLANSPTITSPAMTVRGVILGTAAYMSPEQHGAPRLRVAPLSAAGIPGAGAPGSAEIFITKFPSGEGRWQVANGAAAVWVSNTELVFMTGSSAGRSVMQSVTLSGGDAMFVSAAKKLFDFGADLVTDATWGPVFDVARDGRFLMIRERPTGRPIADSRWVLVQNWLTEFAGAKQ